MFTKAALSRSRLALVVASAFAIVASWAWQAAPAAASSAVSGGNAFNFFDASLVWLRGGPAPTVRNGVLDTPAGLTITTDATPFVARDIAWQITKGADHDRLDVAPGETATFTYTLSVTHDIGPESEWLAFGTIHVHNPNVFDVSGVDITDAVDNGGTCTVAGDAVHTATIPGNNTLDFNYFCTYTSAPSPSSGTSEATVTWPDIGSPSTSASSDAPLDFTDVTPSDANGSVDVVDPQDPDGATLASLTVDDPSPSTFTYSVPFSGDPAGTCTSDSNTARLMIDALVVDSATKTVDVCVGADLTVANTAAPSVTRTFQWGISKSVNEPSQTVAPGTTATFDYAVDVTHDGGTDSWTTSRDGPRLEPERLGADHGRRDRHRGQRRRLHGHRRRGREHPRERLCRPAVHVHLRVATEPRGRHEHGDGHVERGDVRHRERLGFGGAAADFGTVSPTIVDGSVVVTDTLGGTLGTVSYTDPSPRPFTYQHGFSGDPADTCTSHPNTATFTTDTTGTTGSASRSVDVCVTGTNENLTVTKTAQATFTRTFTWGITMSVDPATRNVAAGNPAPFDYAVAVTHDAGTDSNWEVTGTITVSNPNDSGPITLTGVEDAVPGGSCSITSGDPHAQVPASDSVKLDYICTFTSDPGSGLNTATVTWNAGAASTPDGSTNGTASFTFGAPTTIVDGSATVTDTLGGTLGTLSSGDVSPTTLTDHQTFSGDQAGTCTSHPNTATFTTSTTGTTGSDSGSASVCTGADLTVQKTATTSFTRTYKWKITKSVAAPTTVTKAGGSTAAFDYTVNVASDGYVDSAWVVSGKITLTNPNDWQDVTVSLADSLPGCTLASTTVTVPKSGSADVGYSCPRARRLAGDEPGHRDLGHQHVPDAARLRNGDGGLRVRRPDDGARQDRHGEGHVQQLDEHARDGHVSGPRRVHVLANRHRAGDGLRHLSEHGDDRPDRAVGERIRPGVRTAADRSHRRLLVHRHRACAAERHRRNLHRPRHLHHGERVHRLDQLGRRQPVDERNRHGRERVVLGPWQPHLLR